MNVALFGLGRVGLPLALYLAHKKHRVTGYDIDRERLIDINTGKFPFKEAGAQQVLDETLGKTFFAVDSPATALQDAQVVIITVGTPVNAYMNPSFKQVEQAILDICQTIKPKTLIILRSTLAPGTTERIKRLIERTTNFQVGRDLYLAFCPERTAEGKTIEEMPKIPQLIGTLDAQSAAKTQAFFATLSPSTLLSDSRSVEIAKLICNMYRYVNFALANELMMIADHHHRDIYEVLRLANTDYIRGGITAPGFSAGPCLFKDGFFLIQDLPYSELISTSWSINERVPNYLINRLAASGSLENKKIAVLGLAFKKNGDDPRDSLAYKVIKILGNKGAKVKAHDPYIDSLPLDEVLDQAQIIIIATNHDRFKNLGLDKLKAKTGHKSVQICDIWNLFGTGRIIFDHPAIINHQS